MENTEKGKICKQCKISKPVIDFYTNGKRKNGNIMYQAKCKTCQIQDIRNYQKKNRNNSPIVLINDNLTKQQRNNIMGKRICKKCSKELSIDEFYKINEGQYAYNCLNCRNTNMKKYYNSKVNRKMIEEIIILMKKNNISDVSQIKQLI
jgi:hypothetical protein